MGNEPRDPIDLEVDRSIASGLRRVPEPDPAIVDRQIANALVEFAGSAGRSPRKIGSRHAALVAAAAAVLGLVGAGGWWAKSASSDEQLATAEIRPVRGLTSPCTSVRGVYVGETSVGGTNVALFVDVRDGEAMVTVVDPLTCEQVTVLPAPSPGR